jgi:hypothetical protein
MDIYFRESLTSFLFTPPILVLAELISFDRLQHVIMYIKTHMRFEKHRKIFMKEAFAMPHPSELLPH